MSALIESIHKTAADNPQAIAISNSNDRITYSSLSQQIVELSAQLTGENIQVIGLHMDNGPDWIMLDLACMAAGITCVPIPHFFSREQLRHCCAQANIDVMVTDQPEIITNAGVPYKKSSNGFLQNIASACIFTKAGTSINRSARDQQQLATPDIAKVTFTSGTTGNPKGVRLTSQTLTDVADSLSRLLISVDTGKHLCLLPLSTLLENVAGVYRTLLAGNCCVAPPLDEIGLASVTACDSRKLIDAFQRYQPNTAILIPQLLEVIVQQCEQGERFSDSINFLAVGGAHVPKPLLERAQKLKLPVYQGYGLSECGSVVALNMPGASKIDSAGKLLPGLKARIRNGEILIHNRGFDGYLNHPQSGQSEVSTGDIGFVDDQGYVYITGRKKNLIISSYGRNISPEWVETRLLGSPNIKQCVLIGNDKPFCIALIIAKTPSIPESDLENDIDRVNSELPEYARIKGWAMVDQPFSEADGLLTANGRLRRTQIAERYRDLVNSLYQPELETA